MPTLHVRAVEGAMVAAYTADGAPLDEEMLITSVTFEGSRQAGQTTRLELVPKGSIILSPVEPS